MHCERFDFSHFIRPWQVDPHYPGKVEPKGFSNFPVECKQGSETIHVSPRCSFPQETFTAGGVQRGLSPRLYIRQPPLGALWNLSGAPESNNFASAEATGAADKIKMDVEVNPL